MIRAVCFFLILTAVAISKVHAGSCSLAASSLRESSQQIAKRTTEQLAQNPALYCQRSALLEYLQQRDLSGDYSSLTTQEIIQKSGDAINADWERARKIIDDINAGRPIPQMDKNWFDRFTDPWLGGLIPNSLRRDIALQIGLAGMSTNQDKIISDLSAPQKMPADVKNKIRDNIARLQENGSSQKVQDSEFLRALACSDMGLKGAGACADELKKIAPKFSPIGSGRGAGTKFSDLDDWKEVMTDDRYDAGIRRVALQLAKYIYKGEKMESNQNIFDDLKRAFEKSNMTPQEATRASMQTLAVIANGSGNTVWRVMQLESDNINALPNAVPLSQKAEALAFIGMALPVVDGSVSKPGHHLYSLPSNVQSVCDDSKSYHFWMISRLAQRMVQEDHVDPLVAAKTAFTVEKIYQLLREQGRPDDQSDGFTENTSLENSTYNASSLLDRADTSFAAAGAFVGAYSDKMMSVKVNADSSLPLMIKEGEVLPPLHHEDLVGMGPAQKALRWDSVMAPNAAFENIKQQMEKSLQGR